MKYIRLKIFLLGVALLLFSYFSFKVFPNFNGLWTIILFSVFLFLIYVGFSSKRTFLKVFIYNIAAIFFALFLFEGYLWIKDTFNSKNKVEESGTFRSNWKPDTNLGYSIKDDGQYTHKKIVNDSVIYDLTCNIRNGLRFTPNSNESSSSCAMFFGCSFTFGAGLGDSSTLPFFFNEFSDRKYKILNYGMEGYGPHQMLSLIESRVSSDIENCSGDKIAIYVFLPVHIGRAAGYSIWDQDGPNYEVINGSLQRTGRFRKLPERISDRLNRSYIYRRLFYDKKANRDDVLRTLEIIKKSRELFEQMSIKFFVFVWEDSFNIQISFQDENDFGFLINEMKKNNLKILFLKDAIKDYYENEEAYTILHDGHPNLLANKEIARYISSYLKNFTEKKLEF